MVNAKSHHADGIDDHDPAKDFLHRVSLDTEEKLRISEKYVNTKQGKETGAYASDDTHGQFFPEYLLEGQSLKCQDQAEGNCLFAGFVEL